MRESIYYYVLLCWNCKSEFSQSREQLWRSGVRHMVLAQAMINKTQAYLFWQGTTIRCPICDGQQLILCGHDLLEIVEEMMKQ